MTKIRMFAFLLTLIVVGFFGIFFSYYARGYRINLKTFKFEPNGILVIKSEPDGASVYINGNLKTATNATLPLSPGIYDVEVKKEGFLPWYKRLTIEKEVVTQASLSLFKNAPSLSPMTFSGAFNPVVSGDGTKIVFSNKDGLWVVDTFTLPLGFSNDPKKIADGDLTTASYIFSPDGRQILLNTSEGLFLIDSGSFTSQTERVNAISKKDSILAEWKRDQTVKDQALLKNLPLELADILSRRSSSFAFSPDGNMILYTASASGNLSGNLIPPLPGSSTQKQERSVQTGHTYVYDIKEDRNFLISDQNTTLRWMPSSRHVLLAGNGKIVIMDYDSTNKQVVYDGSYITPFAFPFSNTTKLLILTNLGAVTSIPNLYSLTVK